MFAKFKQAKPFRPQFSIGCLFDVATGRYEKGMKGENILNGGVANIEGVTGPGNSFKSTIAHFRMLKVLMNYLVATGFMYDTENSATLSRLKDLADVIDPSGALSRTLDDEELQRFLFTDAAEYNGSDWWALFKEGVIERIEKLKELNTPFLNVKTNECYKLLPPMVGEIDSFSQFQTAAVFKKVEAGKVGDSELNSVSMQNSNGKAQLLDTLPYLTSKGGFTMILTAHMGDTIVMDQYNGPKKKLAFVKATRKMKKTTESFTFLTNNLFEVIDAKPMFDNNKQPEFPRDDNDDLKGMTDLMELTVMPIRTKGGITGFPFSLVVSQRFGLQETLSEYWYLKTYGRFGLTGNQVQQRLAFLPDVVFTRKSIRRIAQENAKFRRAAQFLSELCQINNLWPEYALEQMVEPTKLYEGLKEKGYDWDELLETRGHWTFDQYTNPVKYLSAKDLLEMYHGNYHPYWMAAK